MSQIIIIRREGNFMKALPNIYDNVRDWMRQNSPEPRYLEHAKKLRPLQNRDHLLRGVPQEKRPRRGNLLVKARTK